MERRHFLKIAFGFTAGAVVMASAAKVAGAAPLVPQLPLPREPLDEPQAALATQDDLDGAHLEQVRWGRRYHWRRYHWRRRRWGWHHRHWHRRRYW